MKFFLAVIIFIFCSVPPAFAGGVYGCIINESPVPVKGEIVSDAHTIKFHIIGNYVKCIKVPEGRYSVILDDGHFHKHFTASCTKCVGCVGNKIIHWIIKVKKQE